MPGFLAAVTALADPDDPQLVVAKGEDHAAVADPQRPQSLRRVGEGLGMCLGVNLELVFDRGPDPLSGWRIERVRRGDPAGIGSSVPMIAGTGGGAEGEEGHGG